MDELKERLTKLEEAVSLLVGHNGSTVAMLDGTIAMLHGIATKADENFIKIDDRLGKIENRLNVLTNETSTNFSEVGDQLGGIKAELVKIGAATRYEQHYEDHKRFNILN